MLECLRDHNSWEQFLSYKIDHRLLTQKEIQYYRDYIKNRKYEPIANSILSDTYSFSCPKRTLLNKLGSDKKRIVYTFPDDENMILKFLAYQLHRYDDILDDNCYAFRYETGAKKAFTDLLHNPNLNQLWCFCSDISNYFNSIDITILKPLLYELIDDTKVCELIVSLLSDDRVMTEHGIIHEQKGVMAGTPLSSFLANIYLHKMDFYFAQQQVCYARYSDDIIIFASKNDLQEYIDHYHHFLKEYHLSVNPSKESISAPNEPWTFLGFSYHNGCIDISEAALTKIIGKIRRTSHSLYRWQKKKKALPEYTLRAFIKKYNRKFYAPHTSHELCWARWYFPMINTTKSLSYIDHYMQDCLRASVTGRHNHSNYSKVPYSMLQKCGYRPLVAEYYQHFGRI